MRDLRAMTVLTVLRTTALTSFSERRGAIEDAQNGLGELYEEFHSVVRHGEANR